jgi:NAD(P)-dependent dehydrogenase (short-subunit alcohol dehydrogenase family)
MQGNSRATSDRVWFVTGAASGFGRAVCSAVLTRGERVVATDIEAGAVHEVARSHWDRAIALPLDVADAAATRDAARLAVRRFGRIDVVFNNAGYGHVGAVEELGDAELRRQIDVNLFGNINVTRSVLPYLRRQRSGHLLQMSSLNGVEGLVGGAYYAASKFAIEGLSESLADEVAPFGIRITIIEPGPFRTRFLSDESARWARPMSEYDETVGRTRAMLRALNGRQPGDPARAASAIMRVVDMEDPPLRLPLGHMAVEHIRATLQAELDELERWTDVAAAADFPVNEERRGSRASERT